MIIEIITVQPKVRNYFAGYGALSKANAIAYHQGGNLMIHGRRKNELTEWTILKRI